MSIWRRQPSGRVKTPALYRQSPGAQSPTLAAREFFGPSGPRLYYVIGLNAGWSDPTAAEIKLGQIAGGGAAVAFGNEAAPVVTTNPFDFAADATGLTGGTNYRIAFVWSDGTSDSNVSVSSSFTTTAAGVTVSVPLGTLTLTGFAPTVTASANQSVAVPVASLTLTGFAPSVLLPQLVQVPAAALTLTAYAPTVTATANQWINPPAAALTLTGFAPSVLASGSNVVQVPSAGLTLTGYVPTVTATANQSIAVPVGSLTLTGFAPSVLTSAGNVVQVPVAGLNLTGYAPTVTATANWLISVPRGQLTLTGRAPTVSNGEAPTARPPLLIPPLQLPKNVATIYDRELQQAIKSWADRTTKLINDLASRIP